MTLLARPLFHILPDLGVLLTICGIWALFGAATWVRTTRKHPAPRYELLLHLVTDLLLLTVFLAFSGGTANPLTALYLMPVAAAAAVLPTAMAWTLATTAVAAYAALWLLAVPITVEDMDAAMQMHLAGMWLTFALSAMLLVGIVARMSSALRQRDQRLAMARENSLRNERMIAMGSLAAGAAHQLGTPLNTLTLLADEIAANAEPDSNLAADARELRIQIERCRDIVGSLINEAGLAHGGESITFSAWLSRIVAGFRNVRGDCLPTVEIDQGLSGRMVRPDAALTQSITDLLDNAADSCAAEVTLAAGCNASGELVITVRDGGSGFSSGALRHAGREPWSDKPQGMGMGLYLAAASADRLGGTLSCRNAAAGAGAEVELRIPLAALS